MNNRKKAPKPTVKAIETPPKDLTEWEEVEGWTLKGESNGDRLPVNRIPVLARLGMVVGAGVGTGRIVGMTEQVCIAREEDGNEVAMSWDEVDMRFVKPDPAQLPDSQPVKWWDKPHLIIEVVEENTTDDSDEWRNECSLNVVVCDVSGPTAFTVGTIAVVIEYVNGKARGHPNHGHLSKLADQIAANPDILDTLKAPYILDLRRFPFHQAQ